MGASGYYLNKAEPPVIVGIELMKLPRGLLGEPFVILWIVSQKPGQGVA